jgi:nucleoside-diphosphate-sugar epimerase
MSCTSVHHDSMHAEGAGMSEHPGPGVKVLITGAEGFVGRHFRRHLERTGAEITALDIRSGCDCRTFFRESDERFDLVVHLAAIVGGRATIEGNPIAVATDLSIDAEMFNWVVETRQPRLVYYSSSAAYPVHLQRRPYRLKEADIDLANVRNPDFSYGWAKLTGELLADFARRQSAVETYVFRPFSGYGEDQDLEYPFPSFIKRIVEDDDPFEIWGDGNQVRDFIHVDDVVAASLRAVELGIKGPVNIGWGRPTSFNELAQICFDVAGVKPKRIEHLLGKPVGVDYRCSDNSRLLTFYRPAISLEDGVRMALEHVQARVPSGTIASR